MKQMRYDNRKYVSTLDNIKANFNVLYVQYCNNKYNNVCVLQTLCKLDFNYFMIQNIISNCCVLCSAILDTL